MKYILTILLTLSGEPFYVDQWGPFETKEICEEHAVEAAEHFINEYWDKSEWSQLKGDAKCSPLEEAEEFAYD